MKVRGFEKISVDQFFNDFESLRLPVDYEDIKKPCRGTALSAGYDFFTPIPFTLLPGEEIKLPTGVKSYMPGNEYLVIVPRSGLGFKYYLRLANTLGIIDADYFNNEGNEGHIWIKLRNEGSRTLHIDKEEAVAQGIFMDYKLADGDTLEGRIRQGGFGSTDK